VHADGPVGTSLNKIEFSDSSAVISPYCLLNRPSAMLCVTLFPQIIFGTQSGTIWVLNSNSASSPAKSLPVWALVLICISCFIGGVIVSAVVVCISKRRAASVDQMKKPLLSHHDAL
jgi:hypothetical protein